LPDISTAETIADWLIVRILTESLRRSFMWFFSLIGRPGSRYAAAPAAVGRPHRNRDDQRMRRRFVCVRFDRKPLAHEIIARAAFLLACFINLEQRAADRRCSAALEDEAPSSAGRIRRQILKLFPVCARSRRRRLRCEPNC
jgi:hypothetical protein